MKIAVLVFCLLHSISLFAQGVEEPTGIIYYDVLELSKYVENGELTVPDVNCSANPQDASCQKFVKWAMLVSPYVPEEVRGNARDVAEYLRDNNPFFEELIGEATAMSGFGDLRGALKSIPASLAGVNVTTIADGITQFLVERANEEINIMFFRKFKEFINHPDNQDFTVLFPTTSDFITRTEPFEYAYLLQAFKEAFRKDIASLPTNMQELLSTERFRKLLTKYPEIKSGVLALCFVSQIASNVHPTDALKQLADFDPELVKGNTYSAVKVGALLSESIRSREAGKVWVDPDDVYTQIFSHNVLRNIFLGLLYERAEGISFVTSVRVTTFREILVTLKENEAKALTVVDHYKSVYTNVVEADKLLKDIIEVRRKGASVGYEQYYHFFVTSIDATERIINVNHLLEEIGFPVGLPNDKKFRQYLDAMRAGADIYKYVNEKNYSSAIVRAITVYADVSQSDNLEAEMNELIAYVKAQRFNVDDEKLKQIAFILSDSVENALKKLTHDKKEMFLRIEAYFRELIRDPAWKEKLLRYGSFMAAVAQAESAEDVKHAIKAVALPPGSSEIKARSSVNFSVNGYAGFSYGQERGHSTAVYGTHLPIGLAISFGTGWEKEIGAITLLGTMVDLGAVATYRYSQDNTKALPDLTLQNILAPGGYLVFSRLFNSPLALNAGLQFGPMLREIADNPATGQTSATIENPRWRWNIGLTVDIPIFNVYTRPRTR